MSTSPLTDLPPTVLALGDSYTIGVGVTESEQWPRQMIAEFCRQGFKLELKQLIAQNGWTADELQQAMSSIEFDPRYGIVTLLIGVNNQYRGESVEKFRAEFRELLQFAIDKSGGIATRTLVLSIPDWGATPFAKDRDRGKITREIDEFNRVKREEVDRSGAVFVDISDISGRNGLEENWLASDDLHPSGEMYRLWAERAATSFWQANPDLGR